MGAEEGQEEPGEEGEEDFDEGEEPEVGDPEELNVVCVEVKGQDDAERDAKGEELRDFMNPFVILIVKDI